MYGSGKKLNKTKTTWKTAYEITRCTKKIYGNFEES